MSKQYINKALFFITLMIITGIGNIYADDDNKNIIYLQIYFDRPLTQIDIKACDRSGVTDMFEINVSSEENSRGWLCIEVKPGAILSDELCFTARGSAPEWLSYDYRITHSSFGTAISRFDPDKMVYCHLLLSSCFIDKDSDGFSPYSYSDSVKDPDDLDGSIDPFHLLYYQASASPLILRRNEPSIRYPSFTGLSQNNFRYKKDNQIVNNVIVLPYKKLDKTYILGSHQIVISKISPPPPQSTITGDQIIQDIKLGQDIALYNYIITGDLDFTKLPLSNSSSTINRKQIITLANINKIPVKQRLVTNIVNVNSNIYFSKCVFQGSIIAYSDDVPTGSSSLPTVITVVNFNKAFCIDHSTLSSVVFLNTRFNGTASFDKCEFANDANFASSDFADKTSFLYTTFQGANKPNFDYVTVESPNLFTDCILFDKGVSLVGMTVAGKNAIWSDDLLQSLVDIQDINYDNYAIIGSFQIPAAHFKHPSLNGATTSNPGTEVFISAAGKNTYYVPKKLILTNCLFTAYVSGKLILDGAWYITCYGADVNFSGSTFNSSVNFSQNLFWTQLTNGTINFSNTCFNAQTCFNQAWFNGITNFQSSQATKATVDFTNAIFFGNLNMTNAHFYIADFYDTLFVFSADFTGAVFDTYLPLSPDV